MGFCRYCGEILAEKSRCRCGGFSEPALISKGFTEAKQDRWSRTYVNAPPSPSDQPPPSVQTPKRRFPRPISEPPKPRSGLSSSITHNISSRIIHKEPSNVSRTMEPRPEAGILPAFSPDGDSPSLTKVYGSLLSGATDGEFCAHCKKDFIAEDIMYPQPTGDGGTTGQFLCRECFVNHGGTRGFCAGCSERVLILKSEGGFIQIGDKVYHKQCFICTGCGENTSHNPTVDLLGRPCCTRPECFDTCLSRKDPVKKREPSPLRPSQDNEPGLDVHDDVAGTPLEQKRRSQPSIAMIAEMKRKFMPPERHLSPPGSSGSSYTPWTTPTSKPPFPTLNDPPSPLSPQSPLRSTPISPLSGNNSPTTESSTPPAARSRSKSNISMVSSLSSPAQSSPRTSSRYESPPQDLSPGKMSSFKGASNRCPGCGRTAFAMEKGVVAGPHATRWHSSCLVCATSTCKKKLDSSAKRDANGEVRCRSCWLSLPQELKI